MLQIGVQGQLQVEVDGALADSGGPRQRAVLLRLLLGQGSSVSVDRLLTDLYEGRAAAQRGERPAGVRGGRLRALGRPGGGAPDRAALPDAGAAGPSRR